MVFTTETAEITIEFKKIIQKLFRNKFPMFNLLMFYYNSQSLCQEAKILTQIKQISILEKIKFHDLDIEKFEKEL